MAVETAKDIITALKQHPGDAPCPAWIQEAALLARPNKFGRLYETTRAAFYTEVTVRVPAVKVAKRTGKRYRTLQRRRLDLAALVRPNYKAFEPVVIGVEVKVNKHDLLNDKKYLDYLDFCRLFYFATPPALADDAHEKICREIVTAGLLLVTAETVTVARPPYLLPTKDKNLKEIYAELLLKQFKSNQLASQRKERS